MARLTIKRTWGRISCCYRELNLLKRQKDGTPFCLSVKLWFSDRLCSTFNFQFIGCRSLFPLYFNKSLMTQFQIPDTVVVSFLLIEVLGCYIDHRITIVKAFVWRRLVEALMIVWSVAAIHLVVQTRLILQSLRNHFSDDICWCR